jgi:hypothetical protein
VSEATIEFRITWRASSNITFHGATEWEPWWGDPDDDHDAIEEELIKGEVSEGQRLALEGSGFEWNVETRSLDQKGGE